MFEGFERGSLDIDGTSIAFVKGGDGPPVLLLHGFPQSLAMWAHVAPQLAESFTVICADLRGYGDSSKPQCSADHTNYSFRAMALDQQKLMQRLGFDRFHGIGHDRGGRTLHRLALDAPHSLLSLTVMDIVPTYTMFMDTNRHVASAYWHWYFLSQPEPFPEHMISQDPDFFYETCLTGWGATKISDFDPALLADYRRHWHNPQMIHGSCSDYRAALSVDLIHDRGDIGKTIECPTLAIYGDAGLMAKLFDIPAEWSKRSRRLQCATISGGHFFVDQFPKETTAKIHSFLTGSSNEQANTVHPVTAK